MWSNVKRLLLVVWGVLGLLAILYACLTHGFLWSIYVPIYDRLLHSIPTPPGFLQETDKTTLYPELPWGYRRYKVDMTHEETVKFFVAELSSAGWDLLGHKETSGESKLVPGVHLRRDEILLSRHQKYWLRRYWLIVEVFTTTNPEGVQTGKVSVTLEIYRNEKLANSRYSLQ